MTVKITNSSGRMKVFNLTHDAYCEASSECACTMVGGRNSRRIPSSLTIPTGAVIMNLPDAVLRVPEIARSIALGELRVQRERVLTEDKPASKRRKRHKKKTTKTDPENGGRS